MVLWIVVGVVVVPLAVLAVLLLETGAKLSRLDAAVKRAQEQTGPAIAVVRSLNNVEKPSFALHAPTRTVVGQATMDGERT